jgi:hypothetical protein
MGRLPGVAIRWAKAPASQFLRNVGLRRGDVNLGERLRALGFAQGPGQASAKETAGHPAGHELTQALFNPSAENERREPAHPEIPFLRRKLEEEMHRSVTAVTADFFLECSLSGMAVKDWPMRTLLRPDRFHCALGWCEERRGCSRVWQPGFDRSADRRE